MRFIAVLLLALASVFTVSGSAEAATTVGTVSGSVTSVCESAHGTATIVAEFTNSGTDTATVTINNVLVGRNNVLTDAESQTFDVAAGETVSRTVVAKAPRANLINQGLLVNFQVAGTDGVGRIVIPAGQLPAC